MRNTKKTRITDKRIGLFCKAVAARYHPRRITLFGSHAKGTANPNSDVDLLIEMDRVHSGVGAAATIIGEIQPTFSVDLLIRTPRQLRERVKHGDEFLAEVVRTGKVLYEAPDR